MRPKVGQKRPLIRFQLRLQPVPAGHALEHDGGNGDSRADVEEEERGNQRDRGEDGAAARRAHLRRGR